MKNNKIWLYGFLFQLVVVVFLKLFIGDLVNQWTSFFYNYLGVYAYIVAGLGLFLYWILFIIFTILLIKNNWNYQKIKKTTVIFVVLLIILGGIKGFIATLFLLFFTKEINVSFD